MKFFILLISITTLTAFVHYSKNSNVTIDSENISTGIKIVYNVILDKKCSTYEIFTMNIDGSDKKNVSNWEGADWAYTTFEDKIYFVSDRDSTARMWFLYEMDVNGMNIRRISNMRLEDSYVSVNSTGRKIMITPYIKDKKCFFVLDIKTGIILDTINVPLANIADPCYLPNDKQIVFRGATAKKIPEELFIMNIDGTGLRQLTNYPKNDTTTKWYETHSGTPVWNSNQNFISYFSKQNGNYSIHKVKLDGTNQKKITDDSMNEGWHAWSQDGKLMVYDGSDLEDKNYDIYIMDSDGSNIKRLTTDTLVEQAPLFIQYKK